MGWTILSRTLHTILGLGGLMLETLGVYYDIQQATNAPTGPFGWSLLLWGAILFTLFSISVIAQLWRHIQQNENSYQYSLHLQEITWSRNGGKINPVLNFTNNSDKPIKYEVDSVYVELGGKRPTNANYENKGAVIPARAASPYFLVGTDLPRPESHGKIRFYVTYGTPNKMLFRQHKIIHVRFRDRINWRYIVQEEVKVG